MHGFRAIFRRELAAYFATPLAPVLLIAFLLVNGICTFYLARWFEAEEASLEAFFAYHPWLYLFLAPALAMRLWAEERARGTLELLLTLPVRIGEAVLAKFFAAWALCALALALTFPLWLTAAWLGRPDHGVILAGYAGSWLLAGAYLAVCACLSAAARSQVTAFICAVVVCFLFAISGAPLLTELTRGVLPAAAVEALASISFTARFQSITRGLLDARDLAFFAIHIAVWLAANALCVAQAKDAS